MFHSSAPRWFFSPAGNGPFCGRGYSLELLTSTYSLPLNSHWISSCQPVVSAVTSRLAVFGDALYMFIYKERPKNTPLQLMKSFCWTTPPCFGRSPQRDQLAHVTHNIRPLRPGIPHDTNPSVDVSRQYKL
jgi:hypothetical protein